MRVRVNMYGFGYAYTCIPSLFSLSDFVKLAQPEFVGCCPTVCPSTALAPESMTAPEEVKAYRSHARFYENEFPMEGDDSLVLARIVKFDDKSGCYVSLLEYDGREGMINLGEISKKRIRSMLKILRVGSIEVLSVMNVDAEKGYINLSKKRVDPDEVPAKQEQFAKAKALHAVMQHVASIHGLETEDLCEKISWPLHTKHECAVTAFKRHLDKEIDIWEDVDFTKPGKDISEFADAIKKDVESNMQRKLVVSTVKLMAKCEVSCSEYEGIDAIKEALLEGLKASKEGFKVEAKLIGHPLFAFTCICTEKEQGVSVLDSALELVKDAILVRKGNFAIVSQPQIQKSDDQDDDGDGSGSDDESDADKKSHNSNSDPEDQDETMGELGEAELKALEKIKVDGD